MMQRKGATINFSNSLCDTKQKQNRHIYLNIIYIYRFKKAHLIQGRYERHGERNQSRKYRQERGVTWQRKTKRTA